jgi:hypothetical protein
VQRSLPGLGFPTSLQSRLAGARIEGGCCGVVEVRLQAEEPAHDQADHHFAASGSGVEQPPLITAVDPPRLCPAPRAHSRRRPRPSGDPDEPTDSGNPFYLHVRQVRQQHAGIIKIARCT